MINTNRFISNIEKDDTLRLNINYPTLNVNLTEWGNILELKNTLINHDFKDGISSSSLSVEDFCRHLEVLGFNTKNFDYGTLVKSGSVSVLINYNNFTPFLDSTVEQLLYIFDGVSKEVGEILERQLKYTLSTMDNLDSDFCKSYSIRRERNEQES